jgi:hypothetical protein
MAEQGHVQIRGRKHPQYRSVCGNYAIFLRHCSMPVANNIRPILLPAPFWGYSCGFQKSSETLRRKLAILGDSSVIPTSHRFQSNPRSCRKTR